MSAFIVDPATINNIIHTLQTSDFHGNGCSHTLYSTTYKKDYEWFDRFARCLWITNHKAVRTRYDKQSGFYKYVPTVGKTLSPLQLLKSMQCLSYQCSEFDEEPPTLLMLNKIIDELKIKIIDNMPEYNAAVWG